MKKKAISIILVLLGGAFLGAVGACSNVHGYYQQHFYNGSKVILSISDGVAGYVAGDLSADGRTDLEAALQNRNHKLWFLHPANWINVIQQKHITVNQTITAAISYNEEALDAEINTLQCIDPDVVIAPENAHLTYDENTMQYVAEEGEAGNVGLKEPIEEKIHTALVSLSAAITLDTSCYEQPEIPEVDETLLAQRDAANQYLSASITFKNASAFLPRRG